MTGLAAAPHDTRWRGTETPPGIAASSEKPEEGRFDSWYSALASFVFHFCLWMFIAFMSAVIVEEVALPPAVETIAITDMPSTAGETENELPAGDVAENTTMEDSSDASLPDEASPEIAEVTPVDVESVIPDAADQQEIVDQQIAKSRAAAESARAAAESIRKNLPGNPGNPGGGGGSGTAGRAARWIIKFKFTAAEDYLNQMGALGCEIAFPLRGDQFMCFADLGGTRSSSTRDLSDLSSESRITWSENTFQELAELLGVPPPPSPVMLSFLPKSLEERMFRMELAYKNAPNEESIKQTVFECVQRGGGYDVIVVDQTLVNE
jgi:hypothetical protein